MSDTVNSGATADSQNSQDVSNAPQPLIECCLKQIRDGPTMDARVHQPYYSALPLPSGYSVPRLSGWIQPVVPLRRAIDIIDPLTLEPVSLDTQGETDRDEPTDLSPPTPPGYSVPPSLSRSGRNLPITPRRRPMEIIFPLTLEPVSLDTESETDTDESTPPSSADSSSADSSDRQTPEPDQVDDDLSADFAAKVEIAAKDVSKP
ncbi:uncharacterized protein LOC135944063 isoform X1 [Cloeon dipterum]|uniref:uncharacterized protein LOC135944063 isoform X1 n=1 Tax=Cloeon dipterum TaxID=197152 RepID=UPI00322081E3